MTRAEQMADAKARDEAAANGVLALWDEAVKYARAHRTKAAWARVEALNVAYLSLLDAWKAADNEDKALAEGERARAA
jgi:hypothetical protein